jgi:hypothetical protein
MRSVSKVIEDLGRRTAVADALGCSYQTVRKWDDQGSIPAHWWIDLVRLAKERGDPLSLEELARMAASRRDREQA